MSDSNSEPKQKVQRTSEAGPTGGEEQGEPNEADKGGGADKSKALGSPGLGDRGKVSQDQEKYD